MCRKYLRAPCRDAGRCSQQGGQSRRDGALVLTYPRAPSTPPFSRSPPLVFAPQSAVAGALAYDKCLIEVKDLRIACQLDKAIVNVGSILAGTVEGRVSTEVDPRLADDTGKHPSIQAIPPFRFACGISCLAPS